MVRVHRLEHHCLDVLAAADALLDRDPGLLRGLAKAMDLPCEDARQIVRWCALVHDFGKAATGFQAKSREGWETVRGGIPPQVSGAAHDMIGYLWFKDSIEPCDQAAAAQIIAACSFFHHGRPRGAGGSNPPEGRRPIYIETTDGRALECLFKRAADTVGTPSWPTLAGARRVSWLLTGFVSLVDALGSAVSDKIMEHGRTIPKGVLTGGMIQDLSWIFYLETIARPVAEKVVEDIGRLAFLPIARPEEMSDMDALAGMVGVAAAGFAPSPLQAAVAEARPAGQFLAIIQDVTGSGKTEAAGLMVRRAIMNGIAEGSFWGLPTMATANGLYGRFRNIVNYLHGGDPALVLAHGAREDNSLFRESLRDISGNPLYGDPDTGHPGPACVDWLIEGAHRSLLGHCGVGTIDQALAAALNSHHCGMRWLGLFRKVLVCDEVHAADAGMVELLVAVLKHHASLGGSAVLMSATLPLSTRRRLSEAFSRGAGWPTRIESFDTSSYPLLSVLNAGSITERSINTRLDRIGAAHKFSRINSEGEALAQLTDWSAEGRCAVWFRNTVRDAIRAYRSLAGAGVKVMLFHSRYTRARRAEIEKEVIERFGREGSHHTRNGYVLICTQVAEQSLDLDFDEIIMDLAPIDLILQRLGRRRRHVRDRNGNRLANGPDRRSPTDALLLSPDPGAVDGPEWVSHLLPGTARVYPDAARLWRSAGLLLDPSLIPGRNPDAAGNCVIPHLDTRPLVDAVYPVDLTDLRELAPAQLRSHLDGAAGREVNSRNEAAGKAFQFKDGYMAEAQIIAECYEDPFNMVATRTGDGGSVHLAVERHGVWAWLEGTMMRSAAPTPRAVLSHPDGAACSQAIARGHEERLATNDLPSDDRRRLSRELRLLNSDRPPAVVAMSGDSKLQGLAMSLDRKNLVLLSYDDEVGLQQTRVT